MHPFHFSRKCPPIRIINFLKLYIKIDRTDGTVHNVKLEFSDSLLLIDCGGT